MDEELKKHLAESLADYISNHERYEDFTRREAVIQAVHVLTNDLGAAQRYLDAIGVNIDLYNYEFGKKRKRIKIVNDP